MKCGRSWIDAASKCGTLCPTGNATECPMGELCYADVPDNCVATKMTCGITWLDASSKCGTPCPTGNSTNCPMGELCYADVPDYCSSGSTRTSPADTHVKAVLSPIDNLAESVASPPSIRNRQRTNNEH
eukprot:2382913-Ditylum_brightwellii.AAC.1